MNALLTTLGRWCRALLWLLLIGAPLWAIWTLLGPTQEPAAKFLVEPAKLDSIEKNIAATGTLEPRHFVDVGAQISGQIKRIYVEEGDTIKAGQLLAEIDASVFSVRVKMAEASLENKKAQLRQQEAERELAQLRLTRNESLFKRNAVSDDDLISSRTSVKIIDAKIAAIAAQIKADIASLEGDRVTLAYATIRAPMDGVVVNLKVREGQTINANQNAPLLMTIINLDEMTLRAEVSEADVSKLSLGMPVYFATLGEPEQLWHSTIRQILASPKVINDVVLYQILIDIKNQDHKLMDSMTAQVFFVENKVEQALIVPLGALKEGPRGSRVMVVEDGKSVMRPVKTGIKNRTHAEIIHGLNQGELVVVGSNKSSDLKKRPSGGLTGQTAMGGRRGY